MGKKCRVSLRQKSPEHVVYIKTEIEYDGKQCSQVKYGIKRNTRLMEIRQETLKDNQMGGTAYREKFG